MTIYCKHYWGPCFFVPSEPTFLHWQGERRPWLRDHYRKYDGVKRNQIWHLWCKVWKAEKAGDDAWQAAFDGVLAGVDEELIAIVAQVCRTEVHCLGHAEDFSSEIWVR